MKGRGEAKNKAMACSHCNLTGHDEASYFTKQWHVHIATLLHYFHEVKISHADEAKGINDLEIVQDVDKVAWCAPMLQKS